MKRFLASHALSRPTRHRAVFFPAGVPLFFLVIFLIIMAALVVRAETVVTVSGQAPATHANAHDEALHHAFRNAIETVVGIQVTSDTLIRNASVLKDEIYTFSEGFVEDFQILDEQTANGVLSLQVKARVKANRLNKALFLNGLDVRKVYAWIGEPRVLIRLEETIDSENSSLPIAATSLENLFREKGIAVFRMRHGVQPENRVADNAGLSEQSPAPDRQVDAEIVLSGRCTAQFSRALTIGSYTLNFYSTRLDIQAINGSTGEVLLSASYRSDDRTDTSAQSKFDAASQSIANCIDHAKEDILFNIVRNWYDGFSKPTTHQLTVANVDYDQLSALKRKLMGIEGVRNVFERGYAERTAQLDVKYEGIQDGLVDAFLLLNLPYTVVAKEQNRLALEHR